MFFWKKERQVAQAVEEYLRQTEQCLETFARAFEAYFSEHLGERFEQFVEQTHRYERAADDQRRDIESTMYDKALIPESRGDVLGMVEALDLVPNKCESVLYQVWTQNMIKSPNSKVFVVDYQGIAAGLSAIEIINAKKTARIMLLAVASRFKRLGIGSSLVQKSLEISEQYARAAYVGTQKENTAALSLYNQFGFSPYIYEKIYFKKLT